MSFFNQCRLIDILRNVDLSLLEEDFLEKDLSHDSHPVIWERDQKSQNKKIALISGLAAGSIAVTGVVVFMCRKYDLLKKAA